jgi:hypothetical protein
MKKIIFAAIAFFILFTFILDEDALSWDEERNHMDFSRFAAEKSILRQCQESEIEKCAYLKNLGFEKGLEEPLLWNATKTIMDWIAEGARLEDSATTSQLVCGGARSYNHFHNPLKQWEFAGLDEYVLNLCPPFILIPPFRHVTGESSLLWAQNGGNQQNFQERDWSWQKVRDYYYLALISRTDSERQANFAKTFRGLGHQMHLIQDAAQPDHVRNDAHPEDPVLKKNQFGSFFFESWAKDRFATLKNLKSFFNNFSLNPLFPDVSLNISRNGLAPITQFLDTDQYSKDNASQFFQTGLATSLTIGIAEYTNANFASDDTIFTEDKLVDDKHYFPYPRKSSTDLQTYIGQNKLPETVMGEDNIPDTGFWIKKGADGEQIEHFVRPGYLTNYLRYEDGRGYLYERTFYRDEKCHEDYAKLLIPRAVGYSAALLNYFFRGELQVTAVPIVYKNAIQNLRVSIKNKTPTEETMKDGHFFLTYRYTPTGANLDGSEDKLGLAWADYPKAPEALNDQLKYADDEQDEKDQDERVIDFLIPDLIPLETFNSVKFTFAFKGNLGKYVGDTFETYERDAVIGKVLTLGEIKFEEEWDNGLNGNRTWAHTDFNLFDQNPANGSTSNLIVGDSLVKDNIRNAGYKTARVNESFVSTRYNNGQFKDKLPIKITPNTYIEFKIDEMWINERTPAPPGYTNDWQCLWLGFNNGLGIQFTTQGQGVHWGSDIGYFEFDPNFIIVNNIYDLFKIRDITIPPGDLYLNEISLVQQLFFLDDPSQVKHHQHMKIDSIRIIEGKQQ